jgi:hypothetical protein
MEFKISELGYSVRIECDCNVNYLPKSETTNPNEQICEHGNKWGWIMTLDNSKEILIEEEV